MARKSAPSKKQPSAASSSADAASSHVAASLSGGSGDVPMKSSKQAKREKAPKPAPAGDGYTVAELVARGEQMLLTNQASSAILFLERATRMDETYWRAFDALGDAYAELGRFEEAKTALQRSIAVQPDAIGTKWTNLAQLLPDGAEAVQAYEKGIELLHTSWTLLTNGTRRAEEDEDNADLSMIELVAARRDQCVGALVACAEIYMTDLCMEPDAESRCESYLARAREINPDSLDALQATASMRMSQCREDDAEALMERVRLVLASTMERDDDNVPTYEFRTTTARLLTELGLNREALEILERLLDENDEIAEVWMLSGVCSAALGEFDEAKACLQGAEDLLRQFLSVEPGNPLFLGQIERIKTIRREVEEQEAANGNGAKMDEVEDDEV